MRATRPRVGSDSLWALASAIAALAAAAWLASPRVGYLAGCLAATALAFIIALRNVARSRRWPVATGLVMLVFLAMAGAAQRTTWRIDHDWESYARDVTTRGATAIHGALAVAADGLVERANQALAAAGDPTTAFARLAELSRGEGEHGVVVYRDGNPIAWGGRIRTPTGMLTDRLGYTTSEFYLAMYATASRGRERAVATVLVDARPPADRLSDPLSRIVARRVGVDGFRFAADADSAAIGYFALERGGQRLFGVSPTLLIRERVRLDVIENARLRGAIALAVALALFIAVVWRRSRHIAARLASLGVALACVAIAPLNELSNATRLFDPAIYYAQLGRAFTASVGAFALTAGIVLLGLMALLRSSARIQSRPAAIVLVLAIAGGGPFLMRDLARGIAAPAWGVSQGLWLAWQVALFLAGVSVVLAGATAGSAAVRGRRGLPPGVAPTLAVIAALAAPIVWQAPGRFPGWYPVIWIAAIAALALTRRSRRFMLSASTVAALGAATLVWGNVARKRVELAEREIRALGDVDPTASLLLRRFGDDLANAPAPVTRAAMLRQYVASDLAAANFPVEITAWSGEGIETATLSMFAFQGDSTAVRETIAEAGRRGEPVLREIPGTPGLQLLLAAPHQGGSATTVLVVPRTRVTIDDPFLALLGIGPETAREPPYLLNVTNLVAGEETAGDGPRWERRGNELHGDWTLAALPRPTRAHVEVELRAYDAIVQRGALVLLVDLLIVGLIWTLAAAADGGLTRWVSARRRVWARSYRARLSLVLFGFFVVPALVFALWSSRRLVSGDREARELLVRETLRGVADEAMVGDLAEASERFDTPLLLFGPAELRRSSDPLFEALAPLGRFIDPEVHSDLVRSDEVVTARYAQVGPVQTLMGYRAAAGALGDRVILGAPARTDELALDRRRRDLGILVLFTTAVGALAALWLSGVAARQFAQPIRVLREAALAIARGAREPALSGAPPAEFVPVFTAFRRMTADLSASQRALEEAQRQMAAILRNVASGVIAVDRTGAITLANPRADTLLDQPLPPGTPLASAGPGELATRVAGFIERDSGDEEEFDLETDGRQLHVRLTPLRRGDGGAVVTLDDVSEIARAQRVLAWGEMARQVAHEIKNPLTPIRLGVQHLKRARASGRGDFDEILDQNVARILAEIDRLDEIARAFSRYGMAPSQQPPAAPIDIADIVRDVVALEMLGESSVTWRAHDADRPAMGLASGDELREVLLNILENARLANARRVDVLVRRDATTIAVAVTDDGDGIPAEVLPRIFEPHFSTRTSGSGLGLAISRRMIEGWGGEIGVTSERGKGTRVEITLRSA